ncbi:MAG TPA: hypothetical protein VF003_05205 [Pseudonocardiaceae bacterium]
MTNPVSFVELGELHVALLPARTLLSLLSAGLADGADGTDGADGGDQAAPSGKPGHPGSPGESVQGDGRTITYSPTRAGW